MAKPRPKGALLFDFNGVIIDDERVHFNLLDPVARRLGLEWTWAHYRRRYLALSDADAIQALYDEAGQAPPANLAELMTAKLETYLALDPGELPLVPGSARLIRSKGDEYLMAVVSGARRREIEAVLAAHGWGDKFTVIISADETRHGKPDPEPYRAALERLRREAPWLEARSCLAFEDSPGGILAAKRAGIPVIGITTYYAAADLAAADVVVGPDFTPADVLLTETRQR